METGCEVAKRAFNELTDIQVYNYTCSYTPTIILCLYYCDTFIFILNDLVWENTA